MNTYVMLTNAPAQAADTKKDYAELSHLVAERIRKDCPGINWLANYAVDGPYRYLDIFEAPDNEAVAKVTAIIESEAKVETEVWPATPWSRFKELVRS